MYKAVIFDLDGTLLNTLDDLASACNYALERCNLPIYEVDKYKHFVGNGRYKLIERIIPADKRNNKELYNKVLKLYDEYYEEHMMDMTKAYDGINKMLESLKNNNIKLAVVSNKPNEFTENMVKKYFYNIFDVVYGHRKNIATKPNPDTIFEVIDLFSLKNSQCIYVGDSNVDIQTAKNANVKSIGVSWGFRGRKELEDEGADFIVDNTDELIKVIYNSK